MDNEEDKPSPLLNVVVKATRKKVQVYEATKTKGIFITPNYPTRVFKKEELEFENNDDQEEPGI